MLILDSQDQYDKMLVIYMIYYEENRKYNYNKKYTI